MKNALLFVLVILAGSVGMAAVDAAAGYRVADEVSSLAKVVHQVTVMAFGAVLGALHTTLLRKKPSSTPADPS